MGSCISCMDGLVNSVTLDWQIGIISVNVWKLYVLARRTKDVRSSPSLPPPLPDIYQIRLSTDSFIHSCIHLVFLVTPIPIFGGGDAYSSQGYWESMERSGVDGVMVGRGALIKPWIFTEIKERREWDISARERLELVRKVRKFMQNRVVCTSSTD